MRCGAQWTYKVLNFSFNQEENGPQTVQSLRLSTTGPILWEIREKVDRALEPLRKEILSYL